jgi:hypothetical protein
LHFENHWLIQPHSGIEINPRLLLGRARGSAFDIRPRPYPCGTTHRLCCLRLLAPAGFWNITHPFTISQRWDSCEDPLFDRDQTHTIPGLCGLISALVCGMCGREKVKSDRLPSCLGSLNRGLFIRNAATPSTPLYGPRYVCLSEPHSSADALIHEPCHLECLSCCGIYGAS